MEIRSKIVPSLFRTKLLSASGRSKKAIKNIILSFSARFFSILSSLLIVPLTINYVNPTQYGIWLTLSSVIGWIGFFDLGLGNGFRNKFAEAVAQGQERRAREYLSTTYFAITLIVSLVYVVIYILNRYIDWCDVFNIESAYSEELHLIFIILAAFFCLNMVMNIFGTMLTADQNPGYNSLISGLGQLLSLLAIYILTKTTSGSLTNLATYYAGVPCMTMFLVSVFGFSFTRYRKYRPSFSFVKVSLIKDILNLGLQFFIIYLCLIAIFQMINVVITREIGPEGVTLYNVAKRYYNILYMIISMSLMPIWSAFTEAYVQNDFPWMRATLRKFEKFYLIGFVVALLMLIISPYFFKLWVGNSIDVPFLVTLSVMFLILSQSLGGIYMHMINGIGFIRLQTIAYLSIAVVSWPMMTVAAKFFGVSGVILIPTCAYIILVVLGKIQIQKILSNTAEGIWTK